MTKKRFTIDKDGITVIDNCTNGLTECKYSQEAKLLCNFLNEVTEENEQLKSDVYDWKVSAEDYLKLGKSLKKENEQLKQELHKIKVVNEMLSMDFANSEHELWKENEQLKQQLKEKDDFIDEVWRKYEDAHGLSIYNTDWF